MTKQRHYRSMIEQLGQNEVLKDFSISIVHYTFLETAPICTKVKERVMKFYIAI